MSETNRQMTYEELSEAHRKLWYKNKELEQQILILTDSNVARDLVIEKSQETIDGLFQCSQDLSGDNCELSYQISDLEEKLNIAECEIRNFNTWIEVKNILYLELITEKSDLTAGLIEIKNSNSVRWMQYRAEELLNKYSEEVI